MCDILFVFRLKGIFFTTQNGPSLFSVEIYSCSRDWYWNWNFSMFVDELWNNKKKTQSLLEHNLKVRAEAGVWGTSNQFSHAYMHLNERWAQSRHDTLGGKQSGTTQNRLLAFTKKVDYDKFLLFAKSVLNGHHMLRRTFLPSSTFASPSAFLFDFRHCGVWGHHVWWVQGLLLWRRRSHAEYIIPTISLENSWEMPLTGNRSRQVRLSRAVFQDWGDCAPMMVFPQRPARGDKLLWGFLHVRQHRINCNLWLQPITLWLPRQTFTETVYISISNK